MIHRQPAAKFNHWKHRFTETSFRRYYQINFHWTYSPKRQPIAFNFRYWKGDLHGAKPCTVASMTPSLAGWPTWSQALYSGQHDALPCRVTYMAPSLVQWPAWRQALQGDLHGAKPCTVASMTPSLAGWPTCTKSCKLPNHIIIKCTLSKYIFIA